MNHGASMFLLRLQYLHVSLWRMLDSSEHGHYASTQEGGIDDQSPKRVDQSHVEWREAAYAADIDPEIEPVSRRCLDQGAQRRGVGCPIDQLDELLVFEAVDDAEKPISRAGCDQ